MTLEELSIKFAYQSKMAVLEKLLDEINTKEELINYIENNTRHFDEGELHKIQTPQSQDVVVGSKVMLKMLGGK